jgi:pyruvate dehydrogenase E1 component alpha subunit
MPMVIAIVMVSYRYQGHSMSDPGTTYRTRDEIAQVRQTRDPLHLLLQRLDPAVRAQAIPEIDERAKAAVEEAAQLALADPLPIVDRDLMTDVY